MTGESNSTDAWEPYVAALRAFHAGVREAQLRLRDDLGNDDLIPVARFFRTGGHPGHPLEELALQLCQGHVLDIGAGAGVHALLLQKRGSEVTALEPHGELAKMLRQRGVEHVLEATLSELAGSPRPAAQFSGSEGAGSEASHGAEAGRGSTDGGGNDGRPRPEFDTLLLLMNGWGLAGSTEAFPTFLEELASLLASGGQILADSTAPSAFRDFDADEGMSPHDIPYPGEVQFQWEFQGGKGAPFPFLFLDPERLKELAEVQGWRVEIVGETKDGAYLSRLTRTLPSEGTPSCG